MKISGFDDTIKWYDNNADIYSASLNKVVPTRSIDWFLSFLPKGARVLEAGCAAGRESKVFLEKGVDVIGVDISEELLEIARKENPKAKYLEADFRNLPFNDSEFDAIWSHASLVHMETIENVKKSLNEFQRVLKSSGYLYIYVKAQQGDEKTAVVSDSLSNHDRFFRYYTPEEMTSLLIESGFNVLDLHLCDDEFNRKEVKWIELMAKKIE